MEKCDFCEARPRVSSPPVSRSSNGALVFGDLADEHSAVREALKENLTICRNGISAPTRKFTISCEASMLENAFRGTRRY